MESLHDIASTGAPAIVTALGMGTVFSCLLILYVMTRIIGRWLPRLLGTAEAAAPVEDADAASEVEAPEAPVAQPEAPAGDQAIVAAMALALARHRSSRISAVVEAPGGADTWKIAGRVRALRIR
jgi:sodium pump decarboxylase gamma subunit